MTTDHTVASRNRFRSAAVLAALVGALALASGASAKDGDPAAPRIASSTVLVKFTTPAAAGAAVASLGDRVLGTTANRVHVLRIKAGASVAARVAAYERRDDVVYAEPNYVRSVDVGAPNDNSYGNQWGLTAIGTVAGWSAYPGSYVATGGVKIAIIDTGIAAHPDLDDPVAGVDHVLDGANCVLNPDESCFASAALDDHGHGTHVAGIAGALTNNARGVAGVGFNSPLIPVKVLAANGSGSDVGVANGILWAVAKGARVLNLSLGAPGYSAPLCNAVATATASGTLVVAAAGNDGTSTPSYPAACPGAIGIAATDSTGGSPDWSNWNAPNVFVSAPGAAIYSTYWTGAAGSTYTSLSGTSMASPHVAGLAALLFSQVPTRSPADVKRIIARTASKVGATRYAGLAYGSDPYATCGECTWHPYYGYGQIDAAAALAMAAPATITTFAPDIGPTGSSVTLTGTNLASASSVTLGFVPASFTVDSPTQITATVPAGVAYGRWRITTPAGTAVKTRVFSVTAPTVTGFAPVSGALGSTVTLTGKGFVNLTGVSLGFLPASFVVDSPTQITATVPAAVAYGRWRVTNGVGTAVDYDVYTVSPANADFSVAPLIAPTGATVTLTGAGLGGASAVTLGFVTASFTVDSPTQITATVPPAVAYGRWRVATAAGMLVQDLILSVTAPIVTGFSPAGGAAGSTVTLTGTGFSNVTDVSLGFVPASFIVDSPTQITVTVPSGVEYGRWRVTNSVGTAVDYDVYTVE